jgi:hypothetical protein
MLVQIVITVLSLFPQLALPGLVADILSQLHQHDQTLRAPRTSEGCSRCDACRYMPACSTSNETSP